MDYYTEEEYTQQATDEFFKQLDLIPHRIHLTEILSKITQTWTNSPSKADRKVQYDVNFPIYAFFEASTSDLYNKDILLFIEYIECFASKDIQVKVSSELTSENLAQISIRHSTGIYIMLFIKPYSGPGAKCRLVVKEKIMLPVSYDNKYTLICDE